MERCGNQSLTIFFTSQTLQPYPMVLDRQQNSAFTQVLWDVLWYVVCPYWFFVCFCFFVVFITICPVWVHTTYVFCMIGSYMGSRFACSSHYEILLDLLLFYCLLSSRLTIYKKADRSFYSVWIQSVKFMSGILNLQLTTEQAVTFQVLHSERRLREFEMILDTAQISFRAVEGIICQALWDLMQQVN